MPDQPRYRLDDYDFSLPEGLLAEYPSQRRDESRLMVVHRQTGQIEHRIFNDLPQYIFAGDALVMNNTRVIPARLAARKNHRQHGAEVEVILLEENPQKNNEWRVILGNSRRLKAGDRLLFDSDDFYAEYLGEVDGRERKIRFHSALGHEALRKAIFRTGQMPLPPYIRRQPGAIDEERYQTVYARDEGAVAAPTAGLHFTSSLLETLKKKGVALENVTLHVGLGTFTPIVSEDVREHQMHKEHYRIADHVAQRLNKMDHGRNKLVCVGTTSVRTLESAADEGGNIRAGTADTGIYIYPPYHFKTVDALITNFHTPKSTLLLMVSAFMGYELMWKAYHEAIEQRYRFFSYGDSMLIL